MSPIHKNETKTAVFDAVYSIDFDTANSINLKVEPMFDKFKQVDRLIFSKYDFYRKKFEINSKKFDLCKDKMMKDAREYQAKAEEAFSKMKYYNYILKEFRNNISEIKNSNLDQDEKALAFSSFYLSCSQIEQQINNLEWKEDLITNQTKYLIISSSNKIQDLKNIKLNLETALESTRLFIKFIESEFEKVENYNKVLENYKKLEESIKIELEKFEKGKSINITEILKLEKEASKTLQKYVFAIKKKEEHKEYYAKNNFLKDTLYFFKEEYPWTLDLAMVAGSLVATWFTKGATSKAVVVSLGMLKAATTGYFIGTGLTDLAYEHYTDTATPYSIVKNASKVLIPSSSFVKSPAFLSSSSSVWFKSVGFASESKAAEILTDVSMLGSAGMQAGVFIDTGKIIIDASKLGWTTEDVQKLISDGILVLLSIQPNIEKAVKNKKTIKTNEELYKYISSQNLEQVRLDFKGGKTSILFLNEVGVPLSDIYIESISDMQLKLIQSTSGLGEFSVLVDKNDFLYSLTDLSKYNMLQKGEMQDLLINYSRNYTDYSFSEFIGELYSRNVPVNVAGLLLNEEFRNSFYELTRTKEFQRVYGKIDVSQLWNAQFIRYEGTNPIYRVLTQEGASFFLKFDDCSPDLFSMKLANFLGLPSYSIIPSNTANFAVIEEVKGSTIDRIFTEDRVPINFKGDVDVYIKLDNSNTYLKEKYNHNQGKIFAFEVLLRLSDSHSKNYIIQVEVKGNNIINYNVTRIDYEGVFLYPSNFNQLKTFYLEDWFITEKVKEGFIDTWGNFKRNKNLINFIKTELSQNPNMVQYLKDNNLDQNQIIVGFEEILEKSPKEAWNIFIKSK
ncbi:MAG: hypothetical protein WC356_03235 [Candidatus Micrarchaeia archaeon]|jgi:hypothetical protein